MAKFRGQIGYVQSQETAPGVWTDVVVEYTYSGDVLRNTRQWNSTENLNDDLSISNRFSLVGDWDHYENFQYMRYLKYMGTAWKIISVDIQRPRLIVSVGKVWNGPVYTPPVVEEVPDGPTN